MVAAITLTAAPPEDIVADSCDVLELNHYYDGNGKHVFTQWIFWEWRHRSFRVKAWRMEGRGRLDRRGGSWRLMWHDQGRLRTMEAEEFRVTWTQWDVELEERKRWPVCNRTGLRK